LQLCVAGYLVLAVRRNPALLAASKRGILNDGSVMPDSTDIDPLSAHDKPDSQYALLTRESGT
jgi:hypothetical protein